MKRVFFISIIFGLAFCNISFATGGSFSVGGTVSSDSGGCGDNCGGSGPDVTAPTTAIVSVINGDLEVITNAGNTISSSATVAFSGSDNVTPSQYLTFRCSIDGAAFNSCTSPKTLTGLSLGAHSFMVKSTDGAGIEDSTGATFSWTVVPLGADIIPPETTINSAIDGNSSPVIDSGTTLSTGTTFNFSGADNRTASSSLTFQCSLDNAVFATCLNGKSYSDLTLGAHIFKVRSKDASGNVDATPGIINWNVVSVADTTAPLTTIISSVDGFGGSVARGGATASLDIIFNFSGTDNLTLPTSLDFMCSLDGATLSECLSGTTLTGLSIGSHTFVVRSRDVAGNLDPAGDSMGWTITPGSSIVPPSDSSSATVPLSSGGVFPTATPTTTPFTVVVSPITVTITTIGTIVEDAVVKIADNITLAVTKTKSFVKSDTGQKTVKIAEPVGAISGGVVVGTQVLIASSTITSFYDLYLIILRALGILLGFYVGKKKPWGTVYDSVTKRPLDPAYVVVKNESGKEVADAITDLDGRYGFFLPSGKYNIIAGKTNYEFPSKILNGKLRDELYDNLYFGETLEQTEGEVIVKNIPMDPIGFDWNEFEKNKKNLFRIYSRREKIFKIFFNLIYLIGFALTLISVIFSPDTLGYVFLTINIVLIIYFFAVVQKKKAVKIMYGLAKNPLPYAIVKLFSPEAGNEVKTVVADYLGRFYVLVGPGQYRLRVDNKKPDSSYESVYESPVDLPKGVVPQDIIVENKNLLDSGQKINYENNS
ncbi:MAG: carboxypeptidase-like regulatory domain-containing protein [Patescibacteria group bacterium]